MEKPRLVVVIDEGILGGIIADREMELDILVIDHMKGKPDLKWKEGVEIEPHWVAEQYETAQTEWDEVAAKRAAEEEALRMGVENG